MTRTHRNIGSSLDELLRQEGICEETEAHAIKEVIAWQLAETMAQQSLSKARMATRPVT